MTLRVLEQRPEQPAHPHAAEEFQRIAVEPGVIRQIEIVAGLGRAGGIDQDIAALEALLHTGEHLLAAFELAQVGGDRERRGAGLRDRLARRRQVGLRRGGNHGLRALARERHGDGTADAAAAAGDHGDFSLELTWHVLPYCAATAYISSTTLLLKVPISGTAISITSPGTSQRGVSFFGPSLTGVPVAITSPGLRVMKVET